MARRRRKVNQEQKDKQLKPKKPEKQPDPKMADGPFTANLRLDNKDGMTITEMQHTFGNKAIQRLVMQRFFVKTEETQINSKVVSSPSVMGGGGQGMGMPGSVFPTNQGAEQLPIEMKGGSPATEQQAGQYLPESKAGSQDSLEFKVESSNSQQMGEEALGARYLKELTKLSRSRPTIGQPFILVLKGRPWLPCNGNYVRSPQGQLTWHPQIPGSSFVPAVNSFSIRK